jgi:hypothetical protein
MQSRFADIPLNREMSVDWMKKELPHFAVQRTSEKFDQSAAMGRALPVNSRIGVSDL